ncbi:MAG: tetratricopeptide repeat protein, partial [Myxococcota bacterium]
MSQKPPAPPHSDTTMEVELEEVEESAPPAPPRPGASPRSVPPPPPAHAVNRPKPGNGARRSGPTESTMSGLLDELEGELETELNLEDPLELSPAEVDVSTELEVADLEVDLDESEEFDVQNTIPVDPEIRRKAAEEHRAKRAAESSPKPATPEVAAPATTAPARTPARASRPPTPDAFASLAKELTKSHLEELSTKPEASRAAKLHFEIARLSESPLEDLRSADSHYQQAHRLAPDHLPTLRGYRRVLLARKNFQGALPLFDAEIRITRDPTRKATLHFAKGRLLEDAIGDREKAKNAYETALELDRGDLTVLKAVEQSAFQNQSWDSLSRTYERQANAVSDDPRHRAALIMRRARLIEQRRNDIDAAIELYETALKLDPRATTALRALKRLHHAQRRWRDLIRVLATEAEATDDAAVRTMALYRIARLHTERLGNRQEAIGALETALTQSPNDVLVLNELAHLYESTERWDTLSEVLQRLARQSPPAEQVDLFARLGQLQEERLEDPSAATTWYEAALRQRPADPVLLQALGKLYRQLERWDALVKMHHGEAEGSDDPERRAAAHARIADIYEHKLRQPKPAAEHHKKALGHLPGFPPSFKALTRLLATSKSWRDLVEVYERAIDSSSDDALVVSYLQKVGAIYEDHLDEHAQAAHAYRRILKVDTDNLGAIHAVQRATERAGRFSELVEALELEADKASLEKHRVGLLHRAGEVLEKELNDQEGALARFKQVLELDASYVPALISLGRVYYRAGRWEDLLDMYEREFELTDDVSAKVELLQKMGELCARRIGRETSALEYYRRAVEILPTHGPSLRALGQKLADRGEWEELVKVLELELSGRTGREGKARTSFRIGEVYEHHLNQSDRAVQAYAQALSAMPDFRPAVDALTRLRALRKAWNRLVDDLQREAESAADPALSIAALMRQGEVWAEELGEARRGIKAYEQVLERE